MASNAVNLNRFRRQERREEGGRQAEATAASREILPTLTGARVSHTGKFGPLARTRAGEGAPLDALSTHTHGGHIALPGGVPIVSVGPLSRRYPTASTACPTARRSS